MNFSDTPVGRQIAWVLERIKSGGETGVDEIEEHFAPAFLGAIPAENVQKVFRDLAARGLDSLELHEDPSSPYALRGSAIVGNERVLIGAQTEREEPYRLIMLLFRPSQSIRQIFAETAGRTVPIAEMLEEQIAPLIGSLSPGGLIVGVVSGEETCIRHFGAVLVNQIFEIGSVTKPFTGTLLAEMVARGEVALEDSAAPYFPDEVPFPKDPLGNEIRLLDLVTHSASLPRLPPDWEPADPRDPYADFSMETLYESLGKVILDAPIGSSVRYSNYGFAILGHALSRAAQASYSELVVERVCRPLEMNETGVAFGKRLPGRRAQGFGLSGNEMPHWQRPVFAPAGGIETTIEDLTKFMRAQLNPESTKLAKPIIESQIPRVTSSDVALVGLAWQIAVLSDETLCIWHNGQTGGFSSSVIFHPVSGNGVAAVSNTTSHRLDQATTTILAAIVNR